MDCQAYGTSRLSAQPTSPRGQLTQHTSEPKARGNDKHRGKSTMKKIGLNSLNGNTHQLAGSEVTDSTPHKAGDGQLCLLRLCVCLFGVCYYLCFIATSSTPAYGKIHHINWNSFKLSGFCNENSKYKHNVLSIQNAVSLHPCTRISSTNY